MSNTLQKWLGLLYDKLTNIDTSTQQIVMSVENAIDETGYNLNAAPFSETTDISNDYILDSVEFNFSTAESKTISVTSSDGTKIYEDTNINQHIVLDNVNLAFNGGENITVAVTQFSSAGTMDCILKTKQGSSTLVGTPNVIINNDDGVVGVQNPLQTDGDSVYIKDIDITNSSLETFTGTITDLFDSLVTVITDSTGTDPKHFTIKLNRPLKTGQLNISAQTGNFSNVKIIFYDASGGVRCTHDDSSNNTKYTKNPYNFTPITFSGFKIEFHTSDAVNVGFVYIQKCTNVVARLQGINIEGIRENIGTHHRHLKVLDYLQSIGHDTTADADGIFTECAIGKKTGIGVGAYTLLESQAFVQPAGDTQMYVQSTNAGDAAAGAGIEEITIEYFSLSWGARKTVTVVPDGLNQVTVSVADIYRIHKIYGNDGHCAQGNITITNQATDVLYGGISQHETFMRRCIFYVAENEKITVTQAIIGSTTSGGVNVVSFATHEDDSGNTITRGCATVEAANSIVSVEFKPWVTISNKNNKKKSVGLSVNGNLANQKCTGTIKGFIEAI